MQGQAFLEKARQDQQWAQDSILEYMLHQKQRWINKEIAAGTLKNYRMPIKFFCEAHDLTGLLSINWKKIARGLPRVKRASNDRAPTKDELRKLCEYPDRRIKAIVYTMARQRYESWRLAVSALETRHSFKGR